MAFFPFSFLEEKLLFPSSKQLGTAARTVMLFIAASTHEYIGDKDPEPWCVRQQVYGWKRFCHSSAVGGGAERG